jgi:hypothetical protein
VAGTATHGRSKEKRNAKAAKKRKGRKETPDEFFLCSRGVLVALMLDLSLVFLCDLCASLQPLRLASLFPSEKQKVFDSSRILL